MCQAGIDIRRRGRMPQVRGSWTKVGAVTSVLCVLLGVGYPLCFRVATAVQQQLESDRIPNRKDVDDFVHGESKKLRGYDLF